MFEPVFSLPWWGYILVVLGITHITIAATTIYLHRCMAHRAVDLHPVVSHFFRFWLWLTTGMVTKEWIAVHRKHHANVETADDPHSPQVQGINRILWLGARVYHVESHKQETLDQYGYGSPSDWIERYLYSPTTYFGPVLMLLIDLFLFGGLWGIFIWGAQMLWIPFWAAGVINGIGHFWGYRNFGTPDTSRNIVPWGFIIGGEELHNNHHAFASSAKFSSQAWEFDLGWAYINLMAKLGLAKIRRMAPQLVLGPCKSACDMETVKAVVESRFYVMSNYAREVVRTVYREELRGAKMREEHLGLLKRARYLLASGQESLDDVGRRKLAKLLDLSPKLNTVYTMKQRLQEIWSRSASSHEHLLTQLEEWCHAAEASGIEALHEFSNRLRAYQLVNVATPA